jgi:endonuclease/exonuclease/phosphatase (EEP) superfamily protein YafD
LNSKKELSQQQIKQMTDDILELRALKPELDIIVAGDLNSFMS